jgi:hypothetical protein
MGLQFGRLRAIGPVKFFSGLWNILALAALSAVSAAAYYRVAIVSRAWAAVEGSTTIVTPRQPRRPRGAGGMWRWEGELLLPRPPRRCAGAGR